MQLKFSHIDVLVSNLAEACSYYQRVLDAQVSKTLVWRRDGLHVRYAIVRMAQERFMLVQPITGNLKDLMDVRGPGTIYRHCYSTPDIEAAYDELMARGVQPEDENGKPLARDCLQTPSGARILWLPKQFGNFSIELLEEAELENFVEEAFDGVGVGAEDRS
ncbi:VOC family protein [Paucibacter sp. PLA-PC-4]|uniref:VOC family protein n=1 Tax=Paucibacter sp. PLA-PC-4 TaxID=2993655 RepID=UPI00224B44A6|nr:VOC family protein [Paucibacter sp. PLA-PC-4]MCX2863989.1 VOC family protein [Paucibacter sp. PLA-PC-4]